MERNRNRPMIPTLNSSPNFAPGTSSSPVTNLAFNLKDLTTSFSTTPTRRISFSSGSESTPTPFQQRLHSLQDDGFSVSALAPVQATAVNKFLSEEPHNTPCGISTNRSKALFTKMRSLPLYLNTKTSSKENKPFRKGSTASSDGSVVTPDEDCSSCDSGFSEKEDVLSVYRREFNFPDPSRCQKNLLPLNVNSEIVPKPKISPAKSDDDDGYDFFDAESNDFHQPRLPSGFSNLLNGPLPNKKCVNAVNVYKILETTTTKTVLTNVDCNQDNDTPRGRSCSRGLFVTGKEAKKEVPKCPFKRPEPPHTDSSPVQNKRRKSLSSALCYSENSPVEDPPRREFHRSLSDSQTITCALQRSSQNPDLIGDFSKPYVLPLILGKNGDLKNISPETLYLLMRGEYSDSVEKFLVVDCRYPYEFDGGHIQNARNIYTKDGIIQDLLSKPVHGGDGDKRVILVFHCEFSSERGPNLVRFLRNKDREANENCYPHLYFPEIYVLAGGYKDFYKSYKELCKPQSYMPMLHEDHKKDLRHFRAKSKSWHGDKRRDSCHTGFKP